MDASFFIAKRLRFKGKIAMVSIAVSFLVMIVAVSISFGFRKEIRSGLSMISGDIQLLSPTMNLLDEGSPIESDASYVPYILELKEVRAIVPAAYRAGIIKNGNDINGVLLKGLDSESLPLYGVEFSDSLSMPAAIPSRLAELSGLKPGDRMLTYFVGENLKLRQFVVASVYDSMVQTDDKLIVYAKLSDIQRLNGWNENQVSALEILLDDNDARSIDMMASHIGTLANAYTAEDEATVVAEASTSRYVQLFDWLALLDFNVLFILVLMTVVAGFNMISGLLIMLFESISMIGLLKSLGMTDRGISKVFLSSSAVLVLKAMAWGNALALLFYIVQKTTRILKLDPENYFVSFVPVDLNFGMILGADLLSFAVIMLLLLIPCLFISKVDPAETVRVK